MIPVKALYLGYDKEENIYNFSVKDNLIKLSCAKDEVKDILNKVTDEEFDERRAFFMIETNPGNNQQVYLNSAVKVDTKQKTLDAVVKPRKPLNAEQKEKVKKQVEETEKIIFNPKLAVLKKMQLIQYDLKIEKGKKVDTGSKTYNYWSADDILKAVKPLLKQYNCIIEISDKIMHFQDEGKVSSKVIDKKGEPIITQSTQSRFYIEATATLYDCEGGDFIKSTANAREQNEKYGMDASQLTGSSSSYARKFALSGLLLLDDNKDLDTK